MERNDIAIGRSDLKPAALDALNGGSVSLVIAFCHVRNGIDVVQKFPKELRGSFAHLFPSTDAPSAATHAAQVHSDISGPR
jgi:hypothetical protein